MKFMKGIVVGTLITAGVAMLYTDGMNINKKKIMKKGKQMARKMGILY